MNIVTKSVSKKNTLVKFGMRDGEVEEEEMLIFISFMITCPNNHCIILSSYLRHFSLLNQIIEK